MKTEGRRLGKKVEKGQKNTRCAFVQKTRITVQAREQGKSAVLTGTKILSAPSPHQILQYHSLTALNRTILYVVTRKVAPVMFQWLD